MRRALGIAAGGYYECFWISSVSQPEQMAGLRVGNMSYGTGVQYIDVSLVYGRHQPVSSLNQLLGKKLRL
jgi:hypothetical protein